MNDRLRRSPIATLLTAGALVLGASAHAQGPLLLPENMAALKCEPPDRTNRLVCSSAPGQVFLADEPVNVTFAFARGPDAGPLACTLELQEIGTRTPGHVSQGTAGWTDTVGAAPLLDLIGKPVTCPLSVTFGTNTEAQIEVRDLPLPKRFGTYALVLGRPTPGAGGGSRRQFLGTLARIPPPRADGTVDNTPIFGEGQFMNGNLTNKAAIYGRMGIRGWRSELNWNEAEDGSVNWTNYDRLFSVAKLSGCKIMVTLGGMSGWQWPFKAVQTPAAARNRPNWKFSPYGGQADWLCAPELYPRYEKWIAEFCKRYWENGAGGLWGLENFNEPWEGGGISGWARDCLQYRELQKTIARAARSVDPRIRVLGASSIMNTEDKLFPDGSRDFDAFIDVFTDHYVVPPMCYGPLVASAHGKQSMETETWIVGTEYQLPQAVAQFMASGQSRVSPWHPRVLFDNLPRGKDATLMPTPVVAATAAFNHFVTGKAFEKLVFRDHLPWVFQFGKDNDPGALLVLFGQLIDMGNPKNRLWSQVDGAAGGTMTIDNADGLLKFYDLSGNPLYEGEKAVRLPLSIFPSYITCAKGPAAAAERLAGMRIEGKRPVELLPHDFNTRLASTNATLTVGVHNCLNRSLTGILRVKTTADLTLAKPEQTVTLAAGETRTLAFTVAKASPNESNTYPCDFNFASDAGSAEWTESLTAAIAPKMKITVDGDLDDWKAVPAVSAFASKDKIEPTELMRRPWLAPQEGTNEVVAGRVKLAWDEENVYLCAEVKDRTPEANAIRFAGRDETSYFHSKADDEKEPFKTFLETTRIGGKNGRTLKELGRSFGEVPYIYTRSPETGIPFRRDRVQIAFDTAPGWHDLTPDTDRVPYGFHAVPDTDYEYSLYLCDDGQGEVWRHLAPGVARIHDFPRQPRGKITTGAVKDARLVVTRSDTGYVYECALPKSELAGFDLRAGTEFGFTFKIGNSGGAQPEYGTDKAVCKQNGLTLHPYWETSPSCGVRWTLVE